MDSFAFEELQIISKRHDRDSVHSLLASPPGHSPKAERWPGTDCLPMLQNYTKTGVISKTPCTFREFVRARLDIRPFHFTSTMTSTTVTATNADTFKDALNMLLRELAKLEWCWSYAILQQRRLCCLAPYSCNIAYEQCSVKTSHGFLHRWQMSMFEQF